MKRFSKAIAALLGTATPAGIIGLAAFFGLEISAEIAVSVVSFLGVVATVLAPANAPSAKQDFPEQEPYEEESEYVGAHRAADPDELGCDC